MFDGGFPPSLHRSVTRGGSSMHDAWHAVVVVVYAVMHHATVVPHDNVALRPSVPVDIFRPRRDLVQVPKYGGTLLGRHTVERDDLEYADEQTPSSGIGVRAYDGMAYWRRYVFDRKRIGVRIIETRGESRCAMQSAESVD